MILVDTSVPINFLKGQQDKKSVLFEEIIAKGISFGISIFSYQEVLQGAKDKQEFELLHQYLSNQTIYFPANTVEYFLKASKLYYDLRKKGVTPRSTIDILIALTAIENKLLLLHNDKDFDVMSKHIPAFRCCNLNILK